MAEENENTPQNEGAAQAPPAEETPVLTALIGEKFPTRVLSHHCQHGDETVVISREGMLEVMAFIQTDPRLAMEMMVDLTAVDYLPKSPRFEVVYHFKSLTHGHRLRLKVPVEEAAAEVDSIINLWVAADWYERECAEMYGIRFAGHPDPRPLLLYEGFQGHPLRKDYDKGHAQPLVPLRPVQERYDYGETFTPVTRPEEN